MTGNTMHVRAHVCQYSNRREFDLHVGVLELTQACLLWDKSSGLTSILKRSGLSLTHTHTHTQRCTQNQKCISTYSYTQTHMVRKQVHAKTVNHVKLEEVCALSAHLL